MKTYKLETPDKKEIKLTQKPQTIGTINSAIKLFNKLDNAKRLFYEDVNWDLIGDYDERLNTLHSSIVEANAKAKTMEGKLLSEQKKHIKTLEGNLVKLEREIQSNPQVMKEFEHKTSKENLGALEFYTQPGNLKMLYEMTVEGDLSEIDFNGIDWFMELVKVAGEIQADFFTVFGKMMKQ